MSLTREQYLLTLIQEECAEVAHRASKCLRFGIDEAREGHKPNIKLLAEEFLDLLTVISMLDSDLDGKFGDQFTDDESIDYENAKIDKVEKYFKYSQELGTAE